MMLLMHGESTIGKFGLGGTNERGPETAGICEKTSVDCSKYTIQSQDI